MENDPGQRTVVTEEFPKVYKRLTRAVDQYKDQVLSELGTDERPL